MGCGHMRLLVSVARKNDISELGFNQTLITRVTIYGFMTECHLICFCAIQNETFWWIVTNEGLYLLMVTIASLITGVCKLGVLHFPATIFCQSACLCTSVLNAHICQHCWSNLHFHFTWGWSSRQFLLPVGLPQLQIWITIAWLSCWMSNGTCLVRNVVYRVTEPPVTLSLCYLL